VPGRSQSPETTSGNTEASSGAPAPRRRGALPTPLPAEYAGFINAYTTALQEVPLADDTKRTYISRVRMYLAWLAGPGANRRSRGDPLTSPRARDWAVRDYRLYLLRDATPKRSVRYSNNALAALDDFHTRLGPGKANVGRDDLPRTAPRALDEKAQIRWLRAIEAWPHARDRLLARLPFYAGLRISDAVALDLDDVRMSARRGVFRVFGKGGKVREVPIHAELRDPVNAWLDERPKWKNADIVPALFLSRRGGRLTARAASTVFTSIAEAAGLEDEITAHTGRHTFFTTLIRGGVDLVTAAEIGGHARLDTLRIYTQPTDDDKLAALGHLTVDR
jgi:site-specific recombinase XerD